ncbi:hypothetical protein ACF07S_10635 [Streptomyces sp. NPDC016640]|uniref:hypothetical protein n=1 Tax=Streptomyces sp. NPDC016640 TaxID=3364969 RepID=UPI0036F90597
MEIVSIGNDGIVTVKMTAQEAAAVRDDLGQIWASKVSQPGDKLHSLLEWATPNQVTTEK